MELKTQHWPFTVSKDGGNFLSVHLFQECGSIDLVLCFEFVDEVPKLIACSRYSNSGASQPLTHNTVQK